MNFARSQKIPTFLGLEESKTLFNCSCCNQLDLLCHVIFQIEILIVSRKAKLQKYPFSQTIVANVKSISCNIDYNK